MSCIFCEIVSGAAPSRKIWENEKHVAFLSIFPNTLGTTVVIPKEHYSSYAFDLPDGILTELVLAAKRVGKLLDASFADVGRTGMVLEGFGIDHVHAKLFPLHGTKMENWQPRHSTVRTFYDEYPGYIASHDGERMPDEELVLTLKEIRKE